jgi:putative transposase
MGRLAHRTVPGCTYFVTTKAWANRALFCVTAIADIVIEIMLGHSAAGAYQLHEFVLMPDHLHLLLTPGRETTLEKAMQLIKGGSSYEIHKRQLQRMEIWQAGFHEWTVRDAADFQARASYIRMNPVAAKIVESPEEWLYSSARTRFQMDARPPNLASAAKAAISAGRNVGAKAPTPCRKEDKLGNVAVRWNEDRDTRPAKSRVQVNK